MEKPSTPKSRLFIFLIEFVGYVRESHRDLERIINTAFRHYIKSKSKSKNGNFKISNFEKKVIFDQQTITKFSSLFDKYYQINK
jgi:hypothetical protein